MRVTAITFSLIQERKRQARHTRNAGTRNRRASRVFLFAMGLADGSPSLSESYGVRGLLRNNSSVRSRPLNPYVVRTPSRFPKGRERAMKSTRTTIAIVYSNGGTLVPEVTFVKGLLGFSPCSRSPSMFSPSFSLLHVDRLSRTSFRPTEGFLTTLDERRLITRPLLPVNCSRSTLLN